LRLLTSGVLDQIVTGIFNNLALLVERACAAPAIGTESA
jgi:hypothetical protein